MSVGKVVEVIGSSPRSWEDAVANALKRTSRTVRGLRGVEVVKWTGRVERGKIVEYRAVVKVAFGVEI
jgi:hypothetical protein